MNNNLNNFTTWMQNEGFYLSSKINIIYGNQSNYGVIASADIKKDEILFNIPRKSILSIHNSALCHKLVQENVVENSKWGSLILCIFHELYLDENSKWIDYLKMFPNFNNLQLPMFWNNEDKKLLRGTGIEEAFDKDLIKMKEDYESYVAPFIKKYPTLFKEGINFDMFKYYVAFVMAYSFTKSEKDDKNDSGSDDSDESEYEDDTMPYMVPMADVLNHVSHNNAELIYKENELSMVAVEDIKLGSEVFNTYGALPNSQLLQQYGFTLPRQNNTDDVVEMHFNDIPRSQCTATVADRLDKIKNFSDIVLCQNGFLNAYELASMLHILHTDDDEFNSWFESFTNGEDWEETDENVEIMSDHLEESETVVKVPHNWRCLLRAIIDHTISVKKSALANLPASVTGPSSPVVFVRLLLEGHLYVLENALRFL